MPGAVVSLPRFLDPLSHLLANGNGLTEKFGSTWQAARRSGHLLGSEANRVSLPGCTRWPFPILRAHPRAKRISPMTLNRSNRTVRPQLETLDARIVPSFTPVDTVAVGTSPRSVAVGDFNGDGRLDL